MCCARPPKESIFWSMRRERPPKNSIVCKEKKIDKTMSELTMNGSTLFVFTFITFICLINATIYCPLRETATTKLEAKNKNYYDCPGNLPKHFTECCNDNRCCPSLTTSIYEIDQNLAFMIAATVTLVLLVFAIFLIVCCFCPNCPLYNSCKMRYTRDYAGCAHKMGETPLYSSMMPCESPIGSTVVIAHPLRDKPNGYIHENKAKEAAV